MFLWVGKDPGHELQLRLLELLGGVGGWLRCGGEAEEGGGDGDGDGGVLCGGEVEEESVLVGGMS